MRKDEPMLHVGMADFAEPTLLIVGDARSLVWLADYIDAQQPIRFADLTPSVRSVNVEDAWMIPLAREDDKERWLSVTGSVS